MPSSGKVMQVVWGQMKITLEYDLSDIAESQGIDWDSLTLKQKNEIVSHVTFSTDSTVSNSFREAYKSVS